MTTEAPIARQAATDRHGELLRALRRLDELLAAAVGRAAGVHAGDSNRSFRGVHVELSEVVELLARPPGEPVLGPVHVGQATVDPLAELAAEFSLTPFDVDILLVAIAPDIDVRYERVYAYLQDSMLRKRATVGLALDLLCRDAGDRFARRSHVAGDAVLVRHGLLHVVPDPDACAPPLLDHLLRADEQVVRRIVGDQGLDERLAGFCRVVAGDTAIEALAVSDEVQRGLAALAAGPQRVRLHLRGAPGSEHERAAAAFASECARPLLMADLAAAEDAAVPWADLLRLVTREAAWRGAVLLLSGTDVVLTERPRRRIDALLLALARASGHVLLAGAEPLPAVAGGPDGEPLGIRVIDLDDDDPGVRGQVWAEECARRGVRVAPASLNVLAERFRLTPGQVREAVAHATSDAASRGAPTANGGAPGRAELFAGARAQLGQQLAGLAERRESAWRWDDLVLRPDSVAQLREICARVSHREQVLTRWGLGRGVRRGQGVAALFAGPPGTGKTMAAEILAGELGLDLFRIDLAGVVSKWIGETEKNLNRLFAAASDANAVLFFDEAEALFGKRSEVQDARDRYANVEVAHLLQRLESHEGLAILATNRSDDLDDAFLRRLAFVVRFPLPQEDDRRRLWASVWGADVPLADDLDLDELAREFAFTGAEIRNAAVGAAFLAAAAGTSITREHVRHAVRREYEKKGRTLGRREPAS